MILHFQSIYKLIFHPVWTHQIMVFFAKKRIIGILCSTGKTVLLTTELKCEEYSMVSNVFYAVTFQIGVASKDKIYCQHGRGFSDRICAILFAKHDIQPLFESNRRTNSPCSINTGENISKSI